VFIIQFICKFFYSYQTLSPANLQNTQEKLSICWNQDKCLYLILIGLIVFSTIWNLQWKRIGHNTRIKFRPEKDSTFETALEIIPYLITVFTINHDVYGFIVSLVIIGILGLIIVQTGNIQACAYFFLHGYHIYSSGKNKILTKKSQEQYLLLLDASVDGIEARELTKRVFIVFENR
jgi:hypothetical protein